MSEGLSRFSKYEQPTQPDAERRVEVEPSPESIEAAEQALNIYQSIETDYAEGGNHIGTDPRMYELSALISDPEVKAVFDTKLHESRRQNGWVAPSERMQIAA